MPDTRISTLTALERDTLRLCEHRTSAEIAHILGVAEITVNKRIERARAKLGGISRKQAAHLLAIEEGRDAYEKIIPAEIPLPEIPEQAFLKPSPICDDAKEAIANAWEIREERSTFVHHLPRPSGLYRLPLRSRGHPSNDLTAEATLAHIIAIMIALSAVSGLSVIAIIALMRFLAEISRHGG